MNEQKIKQLAAAEQNNRFEAKIIRLWRVWFLSLACICLVCGGAIAGFIVAERNVAAEKTINSSVTPESLSASFAEVARRVEPAVVNIDTKTNAELTARGKSQQAQKNDNEEEDSSILEYFRKQLPARPSYSVGSGFIVDKQGYILTNYHVVEDTNKITVRLQSGEEFIAEMVGTDEQTDLAVLKINTGRELPAVKLGDSGAAQVGDWVLAIGSPFGLDQTVTAGIISKVERETPFATNFQKFIQTDAAINRGNSGGPLVNMNGEVVGINSQIATSTGDYNGIGFALPSNAASYVYSQILNSGKVKRGFLGVSLDSIKPEFAKVYDLPEAKGALVTAIADDKGAAAKAGLQENDIVVKFNGESVSSAQDLISRVASTMPDHQVEIVYLREINNKLEQQTATITLGERPMTRDGKILKPRAEKPVEPAKNAQQLGLSLTDLTPQLASQNKLNGQKGVLVKDVDPNGIIADVKASAGRDSAINKNDLITRINRVSVTKADDFAAIVNKFKTGDAVVLHVVRYDTASKKIQTRIIQFTFQ
ncbi:MAG: Do family serine endopeptidase [Pyrinomonadaceae bacterium]